jgi:hypothetical protein
LRLDDATRDPVPRLVLMLEKVRERADDFDVLHFHIDYLHFPLFRSRSARILTTLHSRLDLPDHREFYLRFPEMPLVSISNAQRRPLGGQTSPRWCITAFPGPQATSIIRGDYLHFSAASPGPTAHRLPREPSERR